MKKLKSYAAYYLACLISFFMCHVPGFGWTYPYYNALMNYSQDNAPEIWRKPGSLPFSWKAAFQSFIFVFGGFLAGVLIISSYVWGGL